MFNVKLKDKTIQVEEHTSIFDIAKECANDYENDIIRNNWIKTKEKTSFVVKLGEDEAKTEIKAVRGIGYELRCDDV